jgi:hypothetical protein
MTPTASSTSPLARRSPRREIRSSSRSDRARAHRTPGPIQQGRLLGRYVDLDGRTREVLAAQGSAGSVLVVDRDGLTGGDRRLVAHLAADEPAENAALVCTHYLRDVPGDRGRCRRLTAGDTRSVPFAQQAAARLGSWPTPAETQAADSDGRCYRLEELHSGMSIPELRWCRSSSHPARGGWEPVSLRAAVASIESYEPVRAMTLAALERHGEDANVSTTVLRMELKRVLESPIVLNRRLREVVLATAERQALSMSEIASRCGRVKRDRKGNESGETSWLARRLGLLPEAGRSAPTPWIHSDVLALIARHGLGIGPHEVELA